MKQSALSLSMLALTLCHTAQAGFTDQNGDGKADLLWRNKISGQNWLYQMDANNITSSALINVVSDNNWQIIGRGDLDGDGKADILWRHSQTGAVYQYLMEGHKIRAQGFVAIEGLKPTDRILAVNDLNADGLADLVVQGDSVYTLINNHNSFAWHSELFVYFYLVGTQLFSADLYGDGYADVLFTSGDTGFLFSSKPDSIEAADIYTLIYPDMLVFNGQIMLAGDFDGDGIDELLLKNADVAGRYDVVGVNNGYPAHKFVLTSIHDNNWVPVMAQDFDADGDDDILWRNVVTGQNYLYLMQGTQFVGKVINTVSNLNWTLITP